VIVADVILQGVADLKIDVIPKWRKASVRKMVSYGKGKKQVPHRVFDSVRNDIPR
jgi:hypothetical protein